MIAQYTPAAIDLHPGDTFTKIAGGYEQYRGATLVATFLKKQMTRTVPSGPVFINSSTPFSFYEEEAMPGQNVSCTRVQENQTSGAVTFTFSDGEIVEYESWEAVGVVADSVDATTEIGRKILVCKAYRASPDGANKTNQVGAAVSINGLADVPVVYTEPQ